MTNAEASTTSAALEASPTFFQCPLCGGRFSHGDRVCSACPLNPGCDVVGCPHCGYQFPRTSVIVETLGRLLRWLGRRRP